jgi:hypothetical protein
LGNALESPPCFRSEDTIIERDRSFLKVLNEKGSAEPLRGCFIQGDNGREHQKLWLRFEFNPKQSL